MERDGSFSTPWFWDFPVDGGHPAQPQVPQVVQTPGISVVKGPCGMAILRAQGAQEAEYPVVQVYIRNGTLPRIPYAISNSEFGRLRLFFGTYAGTQRQGCRKRIHFCGR